MNKWRNRETLPLGWSSSDLLRRCDGCSSADGTITCCWHHNTQYQLVSAAHPVFTASDCAVWSDSCKDTVTEETSHLPLWWIVVHDLICQLLRHKHLLKGQFTLKSTNVFLVTFSAVHPSVMTRSLRTTRSVMQEARLSAELHTRRWGAFASSVSQRSEFYTERKAPWNKVCWLSSVTGWRFLERDIAGEFYKCIV